MIGTTFKLSGSSSFVYEYRCRIGRYAPYHQSRSWIIGSLPSSSGRSMCHFPYRSSALGYCLFHTRQLHMSQLVSATDNRVLFFGSERNQYYHVLSCWSYGALLCSTPRRTSQPPQYLQDTSLPVPSSLHRLPGSMEVRRVIISQPLNGFLFPFFFFFFFTARVKISHLHFRQQGCCNLKFIPYLFRPLNLHN